MVSEGGEGGSAWNRFGPYYNEEGLDKRLPSDVSRDDLISITTLEGIEIYPHAQFDEIPGEDGEVVELRLRPRVIALHGLLIQPAIEEGVLDEYMALNFLRYADELAQDDLPEERIDAIYDTVTGTLQRWRH